MKGANKPGLPAYVGLPSAESVYLYPGYQGAAYLGGEHDPFAVNNDIRYLHHTYKTKVEAPTCFKSATGLDQSRAQDRSHLMASLDRLRRDVDNTGVMEVMDSHHQAALSLVFGGSAMDAFDISKEPENIKDLYGRNEEGNKMIVARRLVERGVRFVQVSVGGYDHHSDIKTAMTNTAMRYDQAFAGLLTDLKQRGLLDSVLVIWGGEFGRTVTAGGGAGLPGRDHKGKAFSVWMAGGNAKGGQRYGETDETGGKSIKDIVHIHDLHATILHLMGFDHTKLTYNYNGREFRLTDNFGNVIKELVT
jgi:uncharacterized protein (DUF1501 family)